MLGWVAWGVKGTMDMVFLGVVAVTSSIREGARMPTLSKMWRCNRLVLTANPSKAPPCWQTPGASHAHAHAQQDRDGTTVYGCRCLQRHKSSIKQMT